MEGASLHPTQEFQSDKIVSSLYSDDLIVAHTAKNVLRLSNGTQRKKNIKHNFLPSH